MIRPAIRKQPDHPAIHPLSGVLGVIQPRLVSRGTLAGATRQLVDGRMALALRDNPPAALQLALLQAYRRNRPHAH